MEHALPLTYRSRAGLSSDSGKDLVNVTLIQVGDPPSRKPRVPALKDTDDFTGGNLKENQSAHEAAAA